MDVCPKLWMHVFRSSDVSFLGTHIPCNRNVVSTNDDKIDRSITQSAIALSHEGKRNVERVVHCCKTRVEERLSLKNLIGGWVSSRGLVSDKKIPLWKMIYRRYSLFLTWECVFPRLPRITVSPYGLRLFAIVSFRVVVESWLLRIRRKNDLL